PVPAAHRPGSGAEPQPELLVRLLPAVPEPESDPAQPIALADPGPELLVRPVLRRLPAARRRPPPRRRRPPRAPGGRPRRPPPRRARSFRPQATGPAGP